MMIYNSYIEWPISFYEGETRMQFHVELLLLPSEFASFIFGLIFSFSLFFRLLLSCITLAAAYWMRDNRMRIKCVERVIFV